MFHLILFEIVCEGMPEKIRYFYDLSCQPFCINSKKDLRLLKQFKKILLKNYNIWEKTGGSDKFLTKIQITEERIPHLSKNKL